MSFSDVAFSTWNCSPFRSIVNVVAWPESSRSDSVCSSASSTIRDSLKALSGVVDLSVIDRELKVISPPELFEIARSVPVMFAVTPVIPASVIALSIALLISVSPAFSGILKSMDLVNLKIMGISEESPKAF